jgi:hypothetical protein
MTVAQSQVALLFNASLGPLPINYMRELDSLTSDPEILKMVSRFIMVWFI